MQYFFNFVIVTKLKTIILKTSFNYVFSQITIYSNIKTQIWVNDVCSQHGIFTECPAP